MTEQTIDTKPYDSTFKTLMRCCTELLVALINYAFGEHFDLDSAVTFLQSEVYVTDENGERRPRIPDLVFRLMDHMFHMEFQTYGDNTIEIRLFETGIGAAMRESRIESGMIEAEYPRQAVLFLNCPKNTPDSITMRLKLPTGMISEWLVPVIKLLALTLDEICDRGLYVLLPFFLFWYGREGLRQCNDDEARLEGLRAMASDVRARLRQAYEEGKISDVTFKVLLEAMEYVSRHLAAGYDNVIKAVDTMIGVNMTSDMIEFPTLRRLREAREEGILLGEQRGEQKGRQRGRQEGMLSTLFGLVRDGILGVTIAAKRSGLSLKAFKAKMAEYEASLQA